MTIESATTPDQFNTALPLNTDPEAEGAAHIRLIKSVLQSFYASATSAVANAVPSGTIVAFHGSTIPSGWVKCDGTNGTPNLVGVMVIGAGGIPGAIPAYVPLASDPVPSLTNPTLAPQVATLQYIMKS